MKKDKSDIPKHIAIIMDPTNFFEYGYAYLTKLAGREYGFKEQL